MVDAPVSAFFNLDERDLTSLHGLEARLKVLERSFVVHDEIVRDFALLVQIDKLTIVKPSLMLVLHRVSVLCKRALAFHLCQDEHRAISINVLRPNRINLGKIKEFVKWAPWSHRLIFIRNRLPPVMCYRCSLSF